jgi:hypothetical protein
MRNTLGIVTILGLCATCALASISYSTGFEPGEGFVPGFVGGQNGWTTLSLASHLQPVVTTTDPASGSQCLQLGFDSTQFVYLVAAKSPFLGVQPAGHYTVSMDVKITGTGGADYSVTPQCNAAAAARVDFDYMGNLWVRDAAGVAHDTGVAWTVGVYKTLTIDLDAASHTINYYYGGNPLYSGPTWTVSSVERNYIDQVLLSHDQYNLSDVGRFDNLSITPEPASLMLLGLLTGLRRR